MKQRLLGCLLHRQWLPVLIARWREAERQDADVAVCWCCGGPTMSVKTLLCNRCVEVKRGQERR